MVWERTLIVLDEVPAFGVGLDWPHCAIAYKVIDACHYLVGLPACESSNKTHLFSANSWIWLWMYGWPGVWQARHYHIETQECGLWRIIWIKTRTLIITKKSKIEWAIVECFIYAKSTWPSLQQMGSPRFAKTSCKVEPKKYLDEVSKSELMWNAWIVVRSCGIFLSPASMAEPLSFWFRLSAG